jgi:hypothetical protein
MTLGRIVAAITLNHSAATVTYDHTVTRMTLNNITATIILDSMVDFDTIAALVIPLVALLMLSPVM